MKLARKLTLAILAVMVAVLALNAVERIARDRRLIRADILRDHRALGHALQVLVSETLREDGEPRALALVEAINQRESAVQIAWRWPGDAALSELSAEERGALARLQATSSERVRGGVPWLVSYFPVRAPDGRLGVLSLAESLALESEAVRGTVLRTLLATFLIALLAGLVTSSLGVWLVGRPVAQLMEKARRVGAGDLTEPIRLSQRDELADLAQEMNAMCDRLESESRARQHALEQLRHAERLATVGHLAAGIAHELGTPLNVISLESKRIAIGRAAGQAAQEGASVIATQAERMTDIIRQLLDFARRRTPRTTRVELGALAAETVGLVGTLAARRGATLHHVCEQPVQVCVDAGQLQQVLTNLILNAVQASPSGGEVRIETGREPASGAPLHAFVRVSDRGLGIPPEALPHIFEPFFTTKEVGQGTGLGLAVAHGIVAEHGGRIDVATEVGRGTTFTVRLPDVGGQEES